MAIILRARVADQDDNHLDEIVGFLLDHTVHGL